jgi:hypothetical protein
LTFKWLPLMSTFTPFGTTMGLEPIRDSLHCTLSAVRLRQPLLKAAARILWCCCCCSCPVG